jgi:rare lipoprotein A
MTTSVFITLKVIQYEAITLFAGFRMSRCDNARMRWSTIAMGVLLVLETVSAQEVKKAPERPPVLDEQIGDATFYASYFDGRLTASGRIFDEDQAMAAHRSYPFGTVVRVTCLRNKRSVNVVIVDRGPFGKNQREGAIIDLSRSAAEKLGIITRGQARVKVEVLLWGK